MDRLHGLISRPGQDVDGTGRYAHVSPIDLFLFQPAGAGLNFDFESDGGRMNGDESI